MSDVANPTTSRLRIIVTGLVGLHPVGGVAWDYLQYVIGLARLGHDVYYHEDTWSWPYNPVSKAHTDDASYSVAYLTDFFKRYAPDLSGRWHYLHLHRDSFGMTRRRFDEVVRTCDLFINVSGANLIPDELPQHCVKVFLDTDPGYNQIVLSERPDWAENVDRWCESVDAHDRHFTYAENIFGPDCRVPRLKYRWIPTRMPVVRSLWGEPAGVETLPSAPWTTVMSWNAFKGPLVYQGVEYKSKGAEFAKILSLPGRTQVPLRLAVGGITSPVKWFARHGWDTANRALSNVAQRVKFQQLKWHGWQVVDGPSHTMTPEQYQSFIAGSRGEVSTAKHVYVALRTGWFSCRSACYLAAGRPAVVQDTGFSHVLPCGEGLLSFDTQADAAAALDQVQADYVRHREAARALAADHFDSGRVLQQFVDDAFAGSVSLQVGSA
jgi:hypothetical protein